jgi:hypothetical membrane protein
MPPDPAPRAVPRTVPAGAAMVLVGVLQFTVVMGVVQSAYPGYSDLTNYISDLGNTSTSPWHLVFNVSIILLGLLAFFGVVLAWGGFPVGAARASGLPLVLVASVAAIGVGLFPENVNPPVHDIVSLLVFLPGGLGLVLLGVGMHARSGWHWLRFPSAGLGTVTLVSLAYYAPTQVSNTTWDPGLVERLIVAPILIWGFLTAVQLFRRAHEPSLDPRVAA